MKLLKSIRGLFFRFRYSGLQSQILETRLMRGKVLVLINAKRYTIVTLPVGWRLSNQRPLDLQQKGYAFVSKWQAGICPQEMDHG
jgi:hypothetical protein